MNIIVILVVVVVGAIAATVLVNSQKNLIETTPTPVIETADHTNTPPATTTESTTTATESTTSPSVDHTTEYRDGTYTQTGSYTSPAGAEEVSVSLTLVNDVVTNAVFNGMAVHPTSVMVQKRFSEGYEQLVVGKPLDTIALTVVNGSSLTPKGFMDAVAKIKTAAKS